jgi:hypothetical protein
MEKARKCGGVGGGINVSYTAYLSTLDEFFTQKYDDDDDDDDGDHDDDRSVNLDLHAYGQKAVRDLTVTAGDLDPYHNCK